MLSLFSSLAKITNYVHLYPTFQAFSILKVGLFSEMGGQTLHQSNQTPYFGQFLKGTSIIHFFFQKATAVLIESEDKPNHSYILMTFYEKLLSFYRKHCGFLDCFLRTKGLH